MATNATSFPLDDPDPNATSQLLEQLSAVHQATAFQILDILAEATGTPSERALILVQVLQGMGERVPSDRYVARLTVPARMAMERLVEELQMRENNALTPGELGTWSAEAETSADVQLLLLVLDLAEARGYLPLYFGKPESAALTTGYITDVDRLEQAALFLDDFVPPGHWLGTANGAFGVWPLKVLADFVADLLPGSLPSRSVVQGDEEAGEDGPPPPHWAARLWASLTSFPRPVNAYGGNRSFLTHGLDADGLAWAAQVVARQRAFYQRPA
jgi:hypothetical protein